MNIHAKLGGCCKFFECITYNINHQINIDCLHSSKQVGLTSGSQANQALL